MMTLLRMAALPVPTHTWVGLVSDTSMLPMDPVAIWPSLTGTQVTPKLSVFHTPPPVPPM